MNSPKLAVAALCSFLLGTAGLAQTVEEKAKSSAKTVKREVKKGVNRVDETLCTGTKIECAGRKTGHRFEETRDKVVDKADALKESVD